MFKSIQVVYNCDIAHLTKIKVQGYDYEAGIKYFGLPVWREFTSFLADLKIRAVLVKIHIVLARKTMLPRKSIIFFGRLKLFFGTEGLA